MVCVAVARQVLMNKMLNGVIALEALVAHNNLLNISLIHPAVCVRGVYKVLLYASARLCNT